MMRGIFTLVFCLGVSYVFGQTAGDYRSAVSGGSWNAASSWEVFNGGVWGAAASPPTSANGVITIRNNFSIIHNSGSSVITVDQTVVEAGATLTIATGFQIDVANGTATNDLALSGTLQIAGTLQLLGSRLFFTGTAPPLTIVAGTLNNAGTIMGASSSRLQFELGSVYNHQNPSAASAIPLALWKDGSVCRVTADLEGVPPGLSQSFYNLVWETSSVSEALFLAPSSDLVITARNNFLINNTGGYPLYAALSTDVTINVGNDLTIGAAAKFGFAVDGLTVVNVGNNFVVNSNASGGYSSGGSFGSGSVEINTENVNFGTSSVFDASGVDPDVSNGIGITTFNIRGNYSSAGTFRRTGTAPSLEMRFIGAGTHNFISTAIPTFPVNYNVSSTGNLDIAATSRLAGPGTLTVTANARVTLRSVHNQGAYRTSVAQGNVQVTGTRTIAGTLVYGGTALQRISPEHPGTVNTIISNAAHVRMTGNLAFTTGTLDLTAGNLQVRSFTLAVENVAQNAGRIQVQNTSNLVINGTGVYGNMAGNNPTGLLPLVGTQIGSLTINRMEGGLVTKAGNLTVVNLLDIQNGTLALAATTTTVNGNFAAASAGNITGAGGVLTFQNVGAMPADADISGTLATLTMNRAGTLNLTNAANLDVTRLNVYGGNIANSGFLRMANGGTIYRTNGFLTSAIGAAGLYNVQYLNFTGPTITTGLEIPETGTALNSVTVHNTLTASPPYTVEMDKAIVAAGTVRARTGRLVTNDFDITVGVDFQVDATGILAPGWSTLHFNGTVNQRYRDLSNSNYAIRAFDINKSAGTFNINHPVRIYESFGVNSVTAVTVGSGSVPRLTLLSSDTLTAHVPPVPAGATISGRVIVQRFLPNARNSRQYRYISVPTLPNQTTVADIQAELPISGTFANPSTGVFNGVRIISANPSLFRYFENTASYQNYPQEGLSSANNFERGRGYAIFGRTTSTIMYDVRATLNVGTFTRNITRTASVPANLSGYNLVGNPYACPIDWDLVFADPSNDGRLNGGIYFIDSNFAYGNTGHVAYADGVSNPPGFDGVIASGQGFFAIAASSGALTFRESHKAPGDAKFIRKAQAPNVMHISMKKGTDVDYATIRLVDDATENFDGRYDAYKFGASGLYIATLSTASKDTLAINAISAGACDSSVPVYINGATTGNYTLDFTGLETFIASLTPTLYDKVEDKTIVITATPSYSFSVSNAAALRNRFEIRFSAPAVEVTHEVRGEITCVGNSAAVLTLNTSQTGVAYTAMLNGAAISSAVVGNGGSVQIPVNVETLPQGDTEVSITAQRGSCSAQELVQKATITMLRKPTVSSVTAAEVCGSGTASLSAVSVEGNLYNWYEDIDDEAPIAGQHGASFTTETLTKTKTYYVAAVNSAGCEGERVEVKAKVLDLTPAAITVDGNVLASNYETGNQWYRDGNAIDGATGKSIEASVSGVYTVVVNTGSCTTTSEGREMVILGAESNEGFIRVYPNPTPDKLFVEVRYRGQAVVDLISTTGVQLRTTTLSGSDDLKTASFDITSLPDGMYLVRIKTGAETFTKKILKAK